MLSNPAVHTPPLSPDFPSLWDRYAKIISIVWRIAFGISLDDWQVELLRHVLEVYPEGHPRAGELRYRQVVISLARQNGKTELAAILGLLGLLRMANTLVVGIASSAEQATLVYRRTMLAIAATSLKKRFKRLTDTRGIEATDGSVYSIKAAKGAALQGLPIGTGVVDEVHLLKPDLWNALVSGLGGRPNGLVIGISTAGDNDSELLKDLYITGQKAADGDPNLERFGFFVWEAPEARVPADDDEFLAYLHAANPSLASGRLDPQVLLSDMRAKQPHDVIRYHLNRFVESLSAFMPLSLWASCGRDATEDFPMDPRPIFAFDLTPDERYATITVTVKTEDGTFHTERVASIVNPRISQLVELAGLLAKHRPRSFVLNDIGLLRTVAAELKKRGHPVLALSGSDMVTASARFYALVTQKKIKHSNDPLLAIQVPGTIRKNVGERFRLSRKDSSVAIDAVIATMEGIYAAEILPDNEGLQIF